MSYRIEILPTALKSLEQLGRQVVLKRVLEKISYVEENFDNMNHISLRGQVKIV